MFLNGVQTGSTYTDTNTYVSANPIRIGNTFDNFYLFGYMMDTRVIVGSALYTANFTPPTAPLTAVSNTQLLLNYTNGGIYDNAAVADYETVGNAQVSTAVFKYGTGSMYFDGAGDYLYVPSNLAFAFGTGDFTIEFWVYLNSVTGTQILYDNRPANGAYPAIYMNGASIVYTVNAGAGQITGSNLSVSTWYHIAASRTASQTKLFVNGTQVGSTYADTTTYLQGPLRLGADFTPSNYLNGYIDDLRITKGVGRYQYNFTPPAAAFPNIGGTVTLTADPYFRNTTLLLPGNGTNGAQNNTFLDSSSNAFTITRNGNTTQGTFSPFSQTGWGNYFDGNGDYLSIADNAALDISGDFTIEFWANVDSGNTDLAGIISHRDQSTFTNGTDWAIRVETSAGKIGFGYDSSGNYYDMGSYVVGEWAHYAITRSGTTIRTFKNGTQVATATSSSTWSSTAAFFIGRNVSGFDYKGFLSNVRLVKGTAVYTSNFTPSATPLTAITNTSLLTCQSNRFLDASSNAFAITVNGTPSVQAFSPFAPTAAYSASTVGGSGYFDGSGDSLNTTATQIIPATTTYTVEAWIYPTNVSALREIVNQGNNNTVNQFFFYINTTGDLRVLMKTTTLSSGYTVIPNTWTHVAFVSNAGAYTFYVNGVSVASGTGALAPQNTTVYVGATQGGIEPFLGWISNVRISDTARYTSNFTLPTAPFTSDGNTRLLLSATNGGITDATAKNNLETVGNAQISTTQSKFGGSSMYFDGTGDYLTIPNSIFFDFGAGDFTIEMWVYPTAVGQSSLTLLYCKPNGSGYSGITLGQGVGAYTAVIYASSTGSTWNLASGVSAGTMTANAWNHVAVCRYGTNLYGFVNGVLGSTTSVSTTALVSTTTQVSIGSSLGTANTYLTGYIDDLRVTKGIARYTSNFTPPTSAFLLQ